MGACEKFGGEPCRIRVDGREQPLKLARGEEIVLAITRVAPVPAKSQQDRLPKAWNSEPLLHQHPFRESREANTMPNGLNCADVTNAWHSSQFAENAPTATSRFSNSLVYQHREELFRPFAAFAR